MLNEHRSKKEDFFFSVFTKSFLSNFVAPIQDF